MKNLFKTLSLIIVTFILASCSTTARVSYVGLPHKYKDITIKKQIIVRGDYIYCTTVKGTPQIIDTRKYEFEVRK